MTGDDPEDRPLLRSIPFARLRRLADWIGKHFYTLEWPEDRETLTVAAPPTAVERYLREECHAEGVPLSYTYEGQVLDLRIPWGADSEGDQRELHVRGRVAPTGGTELLDHVEKSRYEHTDAHIREDGLEWGGVFATAGLLEDFDAEQYPSAADT